jgi:hypothetical protein
MSTQVLSPEVETAVKMIVLKTLEELSKEPPDKLTLFLYHLSGDFQSFKDEVKESFKKVNERFDNVDVKLKKVDERFDIIEKNMFTKTDWQNEKLRLIEGIAIEFKQIINERK